MDKLHLMQNRIESRAFFKSAHESVISLDGTWRFHYYDAPGRMPEHITDWDEIKVPSCWQLEGYDQMHYTDLYYQFPILPPYVPAKNPTGVYERTFEVGNDQINAFDKTKPQNQHRLRFHGVDSAFEVILNGQKIGDSTGSRYTSEFDMTNNLKLGENTLRVIVKKWSIGTYLEDQDMWWLSGIFRSVEWLILPNERIEDVQCFSQLNDDYTQAKLNLKVRFSESLTLTHATMLDTSTKAGLDYEIETVLYYKGIPVSAGKTKLYSERQKKSDLSDDNWFYLTLDVDAPKLWTAETPFLYDLSIVLKRDGLKVHSVQDKVGLREIKVVGHLILINGQPIHFKGVNRHDFHCDTGRTVSLQDMRYDLELMKRSNMNAVRTAHYPNAPEFYALCDEIGLYVISEADLECHGFELTGRYDWITEDALWTEAYVDRALRLVKRDINRPSVIMWSLGNESEFGRNFVAMAKAIRGIDPSRLIHYEGDRDVEVADVYSTMYTRLERLEEIGKSIDGTKPHLLCEYAHAMGNGPGGLNDYQQLFRKYPRLHGGFIWEWIDHGIRSYDEAGKVFYKYGGDYGDAPHNGNFNCDGLLFPDRTPSSALAEVKKVYTPIWVETSEDLMSDANTICFSIENDYDHMTLDHVRFTLSGNDFGYAFKLQGVQPTGKIHLMLRDGKITSKPEMAIVQVTDIEPDINTIYSGLMLRAIDMRHDGFEITAHQILTNSTAYQINTNDTNDTNDTSNRTSGQHHKRLSVIETHDSLSISDAEQKFRVCFDKIDGLLTSYCFDGVAFLKKGPEINFWRAPIDNDMYVKRDWVDRYALNLAKVYPESFEWDEEPDGGTVRIVMHSIVGAPNQTWYYKIKSCVRIGLDGSLEFDFYGQFKDPKRFFQASLPKIGTMTSLAHTPIKVNYHGLGPLENYPDSQMSAFLGRHEATMDSLFTHYPYPQDNGNRGAISEIELEYDKHSLQISIKKAANFAIRAYSDAQIETAKHMNKLEPEGCFLHLDYKVNGLGSNSCGPEPSPAHKLKPIDFEYGYTWRIKPKESPNESN